MRKLTFALMLASAASFSAPALAESRWERAGADGGVQPRAEGGRPEMAQRGEGRRGNGDNGGGRRNWGGQGQSGQQTPQAVPQAAPQQRGNWDGNRGWRQRNDAAVSGQNAVPQQQQAERNWRGRGGNGDNGANGAPRRWDGNRNGSDNNNVRNGRPTLPPQNGVARNDGQRRWDGNRNDGRRWDNNNDGRRQDNDRNDGRNWNGNRDDRAQSGNWSRNNDGRWQRRDGNWNNNDRRWSDNNRGDWNRGWRNDRRYDWNRYRNQYRNHYRLPRYYNPYGYGYGYRRFGIGIYLDSLFFGSNYWLNDPWEYRLPPAPYGARWVRYYDDVLLVDMRSGYVIDVIYDFFW